VRLPGRRSGPAPESLRGTARRPGSRTGVRPLQRGQKVGVPRPTRPARLTPARAAALLGILASLGSIYGLAETSAFGYARAEIPSLNWTARTAIEAAISIPTGSNLFRLSVQPLEERIRRLPAVADATVVVSLPDTLVVQVTEREAILVWSAGASGFLVDQDGVLFAVAEPDATAAAGLAVIEDSRPTSSDLAIGDTLDPVDLDAATRLGALTPAQVGSVADALVVTVSEANGFVVGTSPVSWVAVFGLYTPSLRTPELVPGQVRLLRSLLDGRESMIAQVILADAENGTFIPKPTPAGATP
jgi:hypothetical protein